MKLPSLPLGWDYRPLKRIGDLRFSSVDKNTVEGEETVRLCNYVDVYKHEQITRDLAFMSASATQAEIRRFTLQIGDVMLTKDSEEPHDIGVPACVVEPLPNVVCGYHLALVRPNAGTMEGRFLQRALQATGIRDQFFSKATGVTRFGLGLDDIGGSLVPVPSIDMQRRIAAFLDRKTAAIDEFVKKKERLIELLQENRQALITHAVTKGLDPNFVLKDSGVPWIGDVPSHWRVMRLKHLAKRVVVGIAEAATHAYVDSGGVPIVRSTDVQPNHVNTSELLRIESWFAEKNRSKTILAGDLLTQRTGEYSGATAVVPPALGGAQCFTLLVTTCGRELAPDFASFSINSKVGDEYFGLTRWGTAQPNISVPILQDYVLAVPPYNEQLEVIRYIKEADGRFASLQARTQAQISRMREYRQALISAAVTGQLDLAKEGA